MDCGNKNLTSFYNDFIFADNHIQIIVIAKSDYAYLHMQYALDDLFSGQLFWAGLASAILVLGCSVGCFIQFVLKKTTLGRLNKTNAKLKDYSLNMTIEMNKAKTAFDERLKQKGQTPDGRPSTSASGTKSRETDKLISSKKE